MRLAAMRLAAMMTGVLILSGVTAEAEFTLPLWPDEVPHATGDGERDTPTITVYLPEDEARSGTGVLVCPGGGYGGLALGHEGREIAEWLNGHGISAFVLRYRHAPAYGHPVPKLDVQRALRMVKWKGEAWGVEEGRLGVMGFSAGGHLAATASTQFDSGNPASADEIERVSSRPDFSILMYPVITMRDPHTHSGSRKNLLGESPTEAMIAKMSAEENVTNLTPPAFLVHTWEDQAVPAQNSLVYYTALLDASVHGELHVFEKGRHGLGLAKMMPGMSHWPALCVTWMKERGFLR